jgi:hypothetical protein
LNRLAERYKGKVDFYTAFMRHRTAGPAGTAMEMHTFRAQPGAGSRVWLDGGALQFWARFPVQIKHAAPMPRITIRQRYRTICDDGSAPSFLAKK